MKSFRDLRVWREAIELVELIYRVSETFPKREHFGLAAQVRKCAVSIPSNVAEGQGRRSSREWLQFLMIARGSLYEMETQIEIARRLGYIDVSAFDEASRDTARVARDLGGLIRYVETLTRSRDR
jgi:four helix bundle protein